MGASVGVVIVTYESGDVLPELLASLASWEPSSPVVVVDDASPSGPPDCPGGELIVQQHNGGYANACNRGVDALRRHDVKYVAFLNPDVRLTGPSLSEMVELSARRRRLGIATGPVVSTGGERVPSAWGPTSVRRALTFAAGYRPGRLRAAAGSSLRVHGEGVSQDDDRRVEGHVIGGTMVARLACFDEIGGFDEEFFLYWEDADLCHRARAAGWEVRVLPCTPFVHADEGTLSAAVTPEQRWEWFVAGAARFGTKHLVPGQARQLEAALSLGRRLGQLRERG